MRVAIIGGGIIGLATAWKLSTAGAEVVLFERDALGSGSSRAAAGMISPLAESVGETRSTIGEPDEVLSPLETPSESIQAGPNGAFLRAARTSRDLWTEWHRDLEADTGLAIEYDRSGTLFLALDDDQEKVLRRLELLARALGEAVEPLDAEDLSAAVPDLSPDLPQRLRGALRLTGEHRVHNLEACGALAVAAERSGVEIRVGEEVTGLDISEFRADLRTDAGRYSFDAAVVTSGAWSGSIPGAPALPVRPVRGQMLQIDGVNWPWQGALRIPGPYYAVRRERTRLVIGATVEEAGFEAETTDAGLAGLRQFVRRTFPTLRLDGRTSAWAGLRPGTTDQLPLVGRFEDRALYYAAGHYRNGILLTPWTAETITSWILGASTEPTDHLFSPQRLSVATRRSA